MEGAADLNVDMNEERGELCYAALHFLGDHQMPSLQGTGRMHPGNMQEWQNGKANDEWLGSRLEGGRIGERGGREGEREGCGPSPGLPFPIEGGGPLG